MRGTIEADRGKNVKWRVESEGKVWEAEDCDDAFMQADFAFMDGASRVVIVKGERGREA